MDCYGLFWAKGLQTKNDIKWKSYLYIENEMDLGKRANSAQGQTGQAQA